MSTVYPSVADILNLHNLAIADTGGSNGVRDMGLVESAVGRPQQTFGEQELYPTLYAKAAALFESLVSNHPFIDGNKRTAALTAVSFMQRNGQRVTASNDELIALTLNAAQGSPGVDTLAEWFAEHSEAV